MDIKELKDFIVFTEYMSFSAASKALYLAQSTLSQRIASIEEEVGVALVERDAAKTKLTDAGEIFADRAQNLVNLYERTVKDCLDASKSQTTIRIQDHRRAVKFEEYLIQANELLRSRYPSRTYSTKLAPLERAPLEDSLGKTTDVCFAFSAQGSTTVIDELRKKGLEGFCLYTDRCYIYTAQKSDLGRKSIVTASDLEEKEFIAFRHPAFASFRIAVSELFSSIGVDASYKLVPYDSVGDYGFLDDRYVCFDCEQDFSEIMSRTDVAVPLAKKTIEGLDLGMDIYAIYKPTVLSPSIKEWLSALEELTQTMMEDH